MVQQRAEVNPQPTRLEDLPKRLHVFHDVGRRVDEETWKEGGKGAEGGVAYTAVLVELSRAHQHDK